MKVPKDLYEKYIRGDKDQSTQHGKLLDGSFRLMVQNDNRNKGKGERIMEEHNNGFTKPIKLVLDILGQSTGINATIEYIDKDSAKDILSRQYGNQRTLRKAHAAKLAEAMNAGEFINALINPIFISDTGKLLDGKHRLEAVCLTNLTIPFMVVRGLPEETYVYIDQNKTRAAKDAVKIAGVRNPDKVAAAAKLIYQCIEGRTALPRHEVLVRMIQDYPDIEPAIAQAEAMRPAIYVPTSVGGVVYFLYSRLWPEECKQFFNLLQYGDQDILSDSHHPITKLKTKLRRMHHETGARPGMLYSIQGSHGGRIVYDNRWKIMMFIHQAFEAYRNNKGLRWKETYHAIDELCYLLATVVTLRHTPAAPPNILVEAEDLPF